MTEAARRPWYEAAFGAHYPLLYRHRDEAEARQCLELLPRLAPLTTPAVEVVLDLGCGDGRHLQWLGEAGHRAVGLDLSPHLLAVAAARPAHGRKPPLVQGDMRCLPVREGSCGSVLSLFTAFGYFGPPEANAAPVAEIARVLAPGGHWFLDYFDGDKVRAELDDGRDHVRERNIAILQIRETRRYRPETRQVCKDVVLNALPGQEAEAAALGVGPQGMAYQEQVAVFTLAEIDALAAAHGLHRVAAAGSYEGAELGQGPRWLLVYRRAKEAAS